MTPAWLYCRSCDHDVQLTHEACDCICGRQGLRYEHFGKLVTIDNWQPFEKVFIALIKQSAAAAEGVKLKVGFYMVSLAYALNVL